MSSRVVETVDVGHPLNLPIGVQTRTGPVWRHPKTLELAARQAEALGYTSTSTQQGPAAQSGTQVQMGPSAGPSSAPHTGGTAKIPLRAGAPPPVPPAKTGATQPGGGATRL